MPAPQVSLVSFATYVLVDAEGVLDSRRAFVSLALFSALRCPLAMLPSITSRVVQVGPDRSLAFVWCSLYVCVRACVCRMDWNRVACVALTIQAGARL